MKSFVWVAAATLTASMIMSGCAGAGCSGGNTPNGQVAVCNQQGSFSYGTNAGMASKTDTYTWSNPGDQAEVHWAMNLGMGSATLTIQDAGGKQVFSKSFSGVGQESSTTTTQTGTPGDWTIQVRLSGTSGQVAFEINTT